MQLLSSDNNNKRRDATSKLWKQEGWNCGSPLTTTTATTRGMQLLSSDNDNNNSIIKGTESSDPWDEEAQEKLQICSKVATTVVMILLLLAVVVMAWNFWIIKLCVNGEVWYCKLLHVFEVIGCHGWEKKGGRMWWWCPIISSLFWAVQNLSVIFSQNLTNLEFSETLKLK